MKNSILIIVILLGSYCCVDAQHYFSAIIPTPSPVNIYQSQVFDSDKLLITYLSVIDTVVGSTILQYDFITSNTEIYEFPLYITAPKGPIRIEDKFYIYADDLQRDPAASFFELDRDFEIINKVEYPAWADDMGVKKCFFLMIISIISLLLSKSHYLKIIIDLIRLI